MPPRILRIFATLVLMLTVVAASVFAAEDNELRDYLNRILAIQNQVDDNRLQKLISDVETRWEVNKDTNYFFVIFEICSALNSSKNPTRAELARTLAAKALDSPGEKPMEFEVRLLLFLQGDPDYVRGDLVGEDWKLARLCRVRRWLSAWQHLQSAKNSIPEVRGPIEMNVPAPKGLGLLPNVPAELVADPILRKEYEKAISLNDEKARVYRQRSTIENSERILARPTKRYTISAYSAAPFNTEELVSVLRDSVLDEKLQMEIVAEVKKRIAGEENAEEQN